MSPKLASGLGCSGALVRGVEWCFFTYPITVHPGSSRVFLLIHRALLRRRVASDDTMLGEVSAEVVIEYDRAISNLGDRDFAPSNKNVKPAAADPDACGGIATECARGVSIGDMLASLLVQSGHVRATGSPRYKDTDDRNSV
jgi:hypothetical protein